MEQNKNSKENKFLWCSKTKFYKDELENRTIERFGYQIVSEKKTDSSIEIEYKLKVYLESEETTGGIMVTKKEFDAAIKKLENLIKDGFESVNARLDAIENCPTVKKELGR